MGKLIAVANQKGGTGKTTSVVNLGAALARFHGKKVLLIDLDAQGSLSVFTGLLPEKLTNHLGTVLTDPVRFNSALHQFYHPELHILPSHPSLDEMLADNPGKNSLMRNMGDLLGRCSKKYDYTLIDCPPALGAATMQSLCAADGVIIPLQCEYMALRGVQLLLNKIGETQQTCNAGLQIWGILPTMFDRRTLHSGEVLREITAALQDRLAIFHSVIYKSIRFAESAVSGLPIFEYDPENPGARAYKKLAREVLDHG